MNEMWKTMQRRVALLAMGGMALAIPTPTLPLGCSNTFNADYQALYEASGDAVIDTVSDNVFGNIGTDFDNVVRAPVTDFVQAIWGNWLDNNIPDDLPNNTIVAR